MAMANAATHNEKWEYEVEGQKIPIPAGFAPTEIEGETSTEDGFVIIDAEGNEFVWIPCNNVTKYNDAITNNPDWSSYQYEYDNKNWTDSQTSVGATSIENNHGFYVARYEAGIPENAPFYASKEGDAYKLGTEKNTNKYTPVSKKGYPAWNFINQTNAKTVSENMYKNNTTVNSYLIDSHAWNYICEDILKEKNNITNSTEWGNCVNNIKTKYENLDELYAVHELEYSPSWGWKQYADGKGTSGTNAKYHKGSILEDVMKARTGIETSKVIELATGASEDFKAYNIYDMAGNMWEWTTETDIDKIHATFRGGCLSDPGSSYPVVYADGYRNVSYCQVSVGFRVVLYL